MENNNTKIFIAVILVLFAGFFIWYKNENRNTAELSNAVVSKELSPKIIELSDEEINTELDATLDVLMRMHYVSLTDQELLDPNSIILDSLKEAMNDLNNLNGLTYKTEALSKSHNEIIATTGLVLNLSVLSLIKTYSNWIAYLRTVDVNNIDLPEFQYQLSLFSTSTHDTYLKIVKNAALLPMITVKFAEKDGEPNSVNENIKNHFLASIDRLFGNILIDNDVYYKKTKNRYAIAILVQGYKDFFASSN